MLGRDIALALVRADELLDEATDQVGRHFEEVYTFKVSEQSDIRLGGKPMRRLAGYLVTLCCFLLVAGCSTQNGEQAMASLVGKWRSEKREMTELINETRKSMIGVPAQYVEPMVQKLKKAGELTEDLEMNPDGTGQVGRTGQELLAMRWRVVRSEGASAVVEIHVDGGAKVTWKVVLMGADRISMQELGPEEGEGAPPLNYTRIR
jgi:hypothetical protein